MKRPGRSGEPLLVAENLSKSFAARGLVAGRAAARHLALADAGLAVGAGEILGIVGESGSGKSTLARCIACLERPDTGAVRLDGQDLLSLGGRQGRSFRRRIQMIFQDPFASLNPRLRVGQAIGEVIRVHRLRAPAEIGGRVDELLEQVGLPASAAADYPTAFSGGQRQRISIARALAAEPDVLIADEPVSALDVSIQAQVINLLIDLRDRFDLAIVFIGHDLPLIDFIAPRKIVMQGGRIVETLAAGVPLASARHPYTRELLAAVPTIRPVIPSGRPASPNLSPVEDQ